MKVLITFICLALSATAYAQPSFCLRLTQVSNDGNNLVIKLEIQGEESFKLGTTNLQFSYNDEAIDKVVLESSPLAPPFYQVPTVTVPSNNQVSFNIELGFPTFGTTIAAKPNWTEVGQVNFDIVDFSKITELTWTYNGGTTTTVVFLDDEASQIFATAPACLEGLTPTSSPLPLDLISFTGKLAGEAIHLDWLTENEENVKGFDVLRSQDGEKWTKIGWVDAKGKLENSYQFIDNDPFPNYNYYKLNMLDYDGTGEYSNIVVFSFSSKGVNVYPNPARGFINIRLGAFEEPFEVEVYDAAERLKFRRKIEQDNLDISSLPSGTYVLLIRADHQVYNTLLVKI